MIEPYREKAVGFVGNSNASSIKVIATGYVSEHEAILQAFTQRRESREEF